MKQDRRRRKVPVVVNLGEPIEKEDESESEDENKDDDSSTREEGSVDLEDREVELEEELREELAEKVDETSPLNDKTRAQQGAVDGELFMDSIRLQHLASHDEYE